METFVKLLKALSDKNRIRIIKLLQQKTLCVCEITAILDLATSTVSSHLSILKDTDIIGDMKSGKWVDYYLNTHSEDRFVNGLLPLILFWLNSDEQVQHDLEKLKTTHREDICKG